MTVCGIDELAGHCDACASHVLSILDPSHPVPEAFGAYGEHERLELRFDDIVEPKPGLVIARPGDVDRILAFGLKVQEAPSGEAHLLVHCHAGISRSTASMVLILAQAMPSIAAEEVVGMVHAIREKAWPNLHMIEMGDARLQRGGTLVEACARLYGLQMRRRPHLGAFMQELGRNREVALAK
jgi:predicted protein tyrosine phosphatase